MSNPQISVIVPVYNVEPYLHQCMDSILAQTYPNIEVICVNDGSTDHSLEILNEYAKKDNRVQVISREIPSGSAALPRNTGLEQAKGKYVIFLDSDDYFDVTMLEKLYTKAEEMRADLVVCDAYNFSDESNELRTTYHAISFEYVPKEQPFSCKTIPDRIFQFTRCVAWNKLVLREILLEHDLKFQLNVPISDDIFFVCALLVKAKRICVISEWLVYYRESHKGAQTTTAAKHIPSKFLALSEVLKMLKQSGAWVVLKNSAQKMMLVNIKWWLKGIGDYECFSRAYDLYTGEYFNELELYTVDIAQLDIGTQDFYRHCTKEYVRDVVCCEGRKRLESGSSIILYGAGYAGKVFYKKVQETGIYQIKMWCDKNVRTLGEKKIYPIEAVFEMPCDALVIAITSEPMIEEVKGFLIAKDFPKEKIYVFSACR